MSHHRMLATALVFSTALLAPFGGGALRLSAGGMPDDEPRVVDHSIFDRILRERVREERVDYLLLRKHDYEDLLAYISQASSVDTAKLPRDEQIALYVNMYNAVMIRAVIDEFHAAYSPDQNSYEIFDAPLVKLRDRTLSLNQLENDLLRPAFKEPRIHVALVCAAHSCPVLLSRAYRGDDLDKVLEQNMRGFLNDPSRNEIDDRKRQLRLSQIFNWYADDFGGPSEVASYVDRYTDSAVSGYAVSFLEYSWTLNLAPPARGRWIKIATEQTELTSRPEDRPGRELARRNEVFEVLDEREGWLRIGRPFGEPDAWVAARDTLPFP